MFRVDLMVELQQNVIDHQKKSQKTFTNMFLRNVASRYFTLISCKLAKEVVWRHLHYMNENRMIPHFQLQKVCDAKNKKHSLIVFTPYQYEPTFPTVRECMPDKIDFFEMRSWIGYKPYGTTQEFMKSCCMFAQFLFGKHPLTRLPVVWFLYSQRDPQNELQRWYIWCRMKCGDFLVYRDGSVEQIIKNHVRNMHHNIKFVFQTQCRPQSVSNVQSSSMTHGVERFGITHASFAVSTQITTDVLLYNIMDQSKCYD